MHLVDEARVRIEKTFVRPLAERLLRRLLAVVVPSPGLFRLSLLGSRLARPLANFLPGRLKGMVAMAPANLPARSAGDAPQVFAAEGARRKRVALLTGCAQRILRPSINEATVRLLKRHGCEVVVAEGAGCCGALVHHLGREEDALAAARANVDAWYRVAEDGGLDAIVINASGCGTTVKDYGFLLRGDAAYREKAARISALARDISEVLADLELNPVSLSSPTLASPPVVAYHAACSLQHGQQVREQPKRLLVAAGFEVREPAEAHLCCGSAGTYNLLQPELAGRLQARKAENLNRTEAAVIATGNIGCLVQIEGAVSIPVVHTVELLDWATGGPRPEGLN
jgi:glycolate oxidase iron-sulfur subunit